MHGRTGGPFSRLLASRLPVPRDFYRYRTQMKLKIVTTLILATCLCGSLSTGWERNPNWQDNEICVGRFRSHDENRIYDYYCVVVAGNQEMR
jgi:hypothetical protein